MDEQTIGLLADAARTACARMTAQHVGTLLSSLEQERGLLRELPWDRKATAHAETFKLVADTAAGALPLSSLCSAAKRVHDLMIKVGPTADVMILNARHRLLTQIRARHEDGAAEEIERLLRSLSFMVRLFGRQ
jgi:hypothetical protein